MILSAENLSLQRGHRLLLQDFNLTLNPGDGLAIRGANGSGKTTLLRALAGLHEPKEGTITGNVNEDGPCRISFLGHQDPLKASENLIDQLTFWAILAGQNVNAINAITADLGLTRQLGLQGVSYLLVSAVALPSHVSSLKIALSGYWTNPLHPLILKVARCWEASWINTG